MGGIENCFQQCDLVFRGAHHCLVCVDDVSPTTRGDAKDRWMVGGGRGTEGCWGRPRAEVFVDPPSRVAQIKYWDDPDPA